MSSLRLTGDAQKHPFVFADAFNSGDSDLVEQVYEPGAVFVRRDGTGVTGVERRRANEEFLRLGLPITVRPRRVDVVGDLALLIVDWTVGDSISGTATDVARRGEDGLWRYVIDNPFGASVPAG
ncbi:nuclear transport factor 2 family protein [Saccharothrix sp. AJ9571]|nr:nuclear transport factor 2 family protein [Saccharothrix sp. AJ9571]